MKDKSRWILSIISLSVFLLLALGSTDTSQKSSSRSTQRKQSRPTSTPGPIVSNSAWDGGVRQVKKFLTRTLKDPDSVEYIEWSPVMNMADGGFTVRCKYRAKNSFGGYVVEEKIFYLDSLGKVTFYDDGTKLLKDQNYRNNYKQPAAKAKIWRDEDGNIHATN